MSTLECYKKMLVDAEGSSNPKPTILSAPVLDIRAERKKKEDLQKRLAALPSGFKLPPALENAGPSKGSNYRKKDDIIKSDIKPEGKRSKPTSYKDLLKRAQKVNPDGLLVKESSIKTPEVHSNILTKKILVKDSQTAATNVANSMLYRSETATQRQNNVSNLASTKNRGFGIAKPASPNRSGFKNPPPSTVSIHSASSAARSSAKHFSSLSKRPVKKSQSKSRREPQDELIMLNTKKRDLATVEEIHEELKRKKGISKDNNRPQSLLDQQKTASPRKVIEKKSLRTSAQIKPKLPQKDYAADPLDVSSVIQQLYGSNRRTFADQDSDDSSDMEANYHQVQFEEKRALKIGKREDLEEEMRELARKKGKFN